MIRFRSFYQPRMCAPYWRVRLFPCGFRFSKFKGWRQCCLVYARFGWRYWSLQFEVEA